MEEWGNRNIDDTKCLKVPFFRFIRKLNKFNACCLCKYMIDNECLVYIHSLDFNHLCNKNRNIPYLIILISKRANSAVRGSSSFHNALTRIIQVVRPHRRTTPVEKKIR